MAQVTQLFEPYKSLVRQLSLLWDLKKNVFFFLFIIIIFLRPVFVSRSTANKTLLVVKRLQVTLTCGLCGLCGLLFFRSTRC